MTTDDFVTVVVPSYNKAQFLAEAIKSVLAQSYENFEIIVVDDGSTDNTREVVERYPMVRYSRQKNQGVSAARNNGLHQSNGSYIVFLDADDRLLPDALEVGVSCLKSHPECAFVSGHVRIIDKEGSVISTPQETCIEKDHYRVLLTYNYIWTPAAVMFRASIFKKVSTFSRERSGAADWDLYLRIARYFPVHCHDHIIADYRNEGVMSSNFGEMLKDSLAVLRSQRRYSKGKEDLRKALSQGVLTTRKYYGDPIVQEVQKHLRKAEWKQALRAAFILLVYYPNGFKRAFFEG